MSIPSQFSAEQFLTRILPGGLLVTVLVIVLDIQHLIFETFSSLDLLLSFVFICSAYVAGEILQLVAHEIEWVIDVFFKFRRPSEVFLLQGNPIVQNSDLRKDLLKGLDLSEIELQLIDRPYGRLSWLPWRDRKVTRFSQGVFWKMYAHVEGTDSIQISNRSYLFSRVMIVEFVLLTVMLIFIDQYVASIISGVLALLFLWRSRGVARGLVFKVALLTINRKTHE